MASQVTARKQRSPCAQHSSILRNWCVTGVLGWCLWVIGSPSAFAANNTRMVDLNGFQQQDLRALSMGNAFGSIARGEAALQYNPAALATYDFDLKADASLTFMQEQGNFISDTLKVTSGTPSNQDVVNYLNKYDGTTQTYILQTFPSAVANLGDFNLGIGAGKLDVQRYQLAFNQTTPGTFNPLTDSLTVSEDRAQIGLGGIGFKLFSGKALIGVTAKNVQYTESQSNVPFSSVVASSKLNFNLQDTNYNSVAAYDAGLIYRVEWLPTLKPQWSLTAYNIGGYTLKGTNPAGVVQKLYVPDTYNFGFSLQPDFGFVHILMSAEYEDLGAAVKVQDANGVNQPRSSDQLVHAGVEVGLFKTPTGNNWLNVRTGSNGGYITYGAEVNLGGFTRFVYSHGTENYGYTGHPMIFKFDAYQVALGFAW